MAGLTVGALGVVNAVGDVIDPDTARPIAGARTEDGRRLLDARRAIAVGQLPERLLVGTNTTIGVVATDAVLTKAQAQKIAQMAHDGLARSINPVHTMSDGDTLFALGTGRSGKTGNPNLLGMLGAEVMARAVVRAVRAAQGIEGYPSVADIGELGHASDRSRDGIGQSRKARCRGHQPRQGVKDGSRVDEARTLPRCPCFRWTRLWTGDGRSRHRVAWRGLQPGAC